MTLEQRRELTRAAVETGSLDLSSVERVHKTAVLSFMKAMRISDAEIAEKYLSSTNYELRQAIENFRKDLANEFLSTTGLPVSVDHVEMAKAYLEWSDHQLETAVNLYLDEKESIDLSPKTPKTCADEIFRRRFRRRSIWTAKKILKSVDKKPVEFSDSEVEDDDDGQQRQRIDAEGRCFL